MAVSSVSELRSTGAVGGQLSTIFSTERARFFTSSGGGNIRLGHAGSPAVLRLAPSVLSADFGNLAEAVGEISAEADWLHVDVMDRHTAPIVVDAGARVLVIGSAIFHAERPREAARQIRKAAAPHLPAASRQGSGEARPPP